MLIGGREVSDSRAIAESVTESSVLPRDSVLLSSLVIKKGTKKEVNKPEAGMRIILPDKKIKPVVKWNDILKIVARYLIGAGKITDKDCPVLGETKRSERPLIRTRGQYNPKDGKSVVWGEWIDDFWLCVNFDAAGCHKKACWLLEKFDREATVLVSYS